ncbi:Hypothetical protein SSCIU_00116 [Mammaliicoccus sciuri]|nr:Hypothetical protein SSCIU_00116 [Mammaliicoccus sciuri]
MTEGIIRNVP